MKIRGQITYFAPHSCTQNIDEVKKEDIKIRASILQLIAMRMKKMDIDM